MFAGFLHSETKQNDIQTKNKQHCRVAEIATKRLVTENRLGLCCISYLTFHVSGGGRRRRNIPFSAGKLFFQAVYVAWMCTAPQNNKMLCNNPKYSGVGGHLFAIAADKSMEYGYNGVIVGYAANEDLVKHYCTVFMAEHIAMLHPYQIAIYEAEAAELREVYDYEWTDEEI